MLPPRYSEANAIALMKQVCHGVRHLHQQNIIHRDLKPEVTLILNSQNYRATRSRSSESLVWDLQNILLCHAEEDTNCKVADFGLSKLFPEDARDLQTQTLCGTPGYVCKSSECVQECDD